MARTPTIPDVLRRVPFTRPEAHAAGLTDRMLDGPSWVKVHHGVWRWKECSLNWANRLLAARLALPAHVRTTGSTRLRELGLNLGDASVLHFVVVGDHHLQLDGVTLHRTPVLPPCSDSAVCAEAALIAFCVEPGTTLEDAIVAGDWLLHHGHASLEALAELMKNQRWRLGVREAGQVRRWLNERSRSTEETRVRVRLIAAGLPVPMVNEPLRHEGRIVSEGDLVIEEWNLVLEYEGEHHQTDRAQYVKDIDRYGMYRRIGKNYLQITRELNRNPMTMVRAVHRVLVQLGYDGPAPDFGPRWRSLFRPLRPVTVSHPRRTA